MGEVVNYAELQKRVNDLEIKERVSYIALENALSLLSRMFPEEVHCIRENAQEVLEDCLNEV